MLSCTSTLIGADVMVQTCLISDVQVEWNTEFGRQNTQVKELRRLLGCSDCSSWLRTFDRLTPLVLQRSRRTVGEEGWAELGSWILGVGHESTSSFSRSCVRTSSGSCSSVSCRNGFGIVWSRWYCISCGCSINIVCISEDSSNISLDACSSKKSGLNVSRGSIKGDMVRESGTRSNK